MAHSVDETGIGRSAGRDDPRGNDRAVRSVIDAAIEADPMSPEERSKRMGEALERCNELRERLLEQMDGPLPSGWSARMIREGRP